MSQSASSAERVCPRPEPDGFLGRIMVRRRVIGWTSYLTGEDEGMIRVPVNALTYDRMIRKWRRRLAPESPEWREVVVTDRDRGW